MKNKHLAGLYKFVIFFLLIAFVVTCTMYLFLHFMEYTDEQIRRAAPITFANVILMTSIFWGFDTARRKLFTERPVRQIKRGLEKIAGGDFTARVEPVGVMSGMAEYNEIVAYINKMAAELGSVETLRTDFVSNVSHEMKTPLAVIQNYAALLGSQGLSEEDRILYARAINDATKRLAALITNILKLNKLENQQIFPESKPFDLSEQVCECMLGFEDRWEEKSIDIDTDIEDGVIITADSELFSLVWNNLFSNAIKFTESGGKVSISVKQNSESAIVSVSDTGCGIDPETGRHIFDKFYQGDTSHAARGNGLGLALVKRIIDITGSEIDVTSEVGKGSTFTVTIRKEDHHE